MRSIPLANTPPWVAVPGDRPANSDRTLQRSRGRVLAWLLIVAMGAVHGWAGRHEMSPDGIAYLDLADAFLRGDWSLAFNRLWSPLYPALLAVIRGMLRPVSTGDFATVHLLNFAIFLGALASFEFLLSQLADDHRRFAARAASAGRRALPEWFLRLLGYALFAYSSLELTPVPLVSPDLLVSVFVYLAVGLLLKLRREPDSMASFLLLGAVLGLGYLAKASMFPLAFVFLALGVASIRRHLPVRDVVRRVLAALIPFTLITGSLVLAFARTGQGATLGESGKLNYAYHINGLPYVHWQGEVPGSGRPAHPTRTIFPSPPVYEFATPVGGTYPPWDDPAYWYEGVRVRFDAKGHLSNIVRSARVLLGILLRSSQISLVIGGLLLLHLGRRKRLVLQDILPYAMLLAPLLAAIGMFSMVWLERRFVAPFLPPFWLGVFAPMTFAESSAERMIKRVTVAMLAMLALVTLVTSYAMAKGLLARGSANQQVAVAQGLQQLGVHPGDEVAVISDWPGGADAYWARLSTVRIIAEMPACRAYAGSLCPTGQRDGVFAFVRADPGLRNRILGVFEATGAEAVVMRSVDHIPLPGWRRISGTDYYVYLLGDEASQGGDHGRHRP